MVDCIWSAFIKDGREDSYLWTETYMQSNLRILVDTKQDPDKKDGKDRNDIDKASDKANDKANDKASDKDSGAFGLQAGVAVRAGSKIQELLLENNKTNSPIYIYSCGSFEMAETAFVKGYAVALGGHEVVLQEVIKNYPGQYDFQAGSLMTADLAVAFCKDDASDKYTNINDAIKSMKADGTIDKILKKYNADSIETEDSANEED